MLRRSYILLVFILCLTASCQQQSAAQVAKLYPVDEAFRDPSFFVFRARLIEAIQQRDSSFVVSTLSPNIKNSFGSNDGIEEFKLFWKPENPDSKFWNTFTKVIALGGSFDSANRFKAPYIYSKFPDSIDAFTHGVIVGENVRVRKEPGLSALVIGTLSFDIVKVMDWSPQAQDVNGQKWVLIALREGQNGYVAETYIRSPIAYRAGFEKRDGQWFLTFFVSGD